MHYRPIDIARRLGVSTSMLRNYEALGLLPPVPRSASGYRLFTQEHLAYFTCARRMQPGFTLIEIERIFRHIMAGELTGACWLATRGIAELDHERKIADTIEARLLRTALPPAGEGPLMTIRALSRDTGIPVTTLRHWDSVGLLPAQRNPANRYRLYSPSHATLALLIYALKLSTYASRGKYYINEMKHDLSAIDPSDRQTVMDIVATMREYLNGINQARLWAIAALHDLWLELHPESS